jgi:hypothetical protein
VLGHLRLVQAQGLADRPDGERPGVEQLDDAQAIRLGQGGARFRDLLERRVEW